MPADGRWDITRLLKSQFCTSGNNYMADVGVCVRAVETTRCCELMYKKGLYGLVVIGTDRMKFDDVVHSVKEERNILFTKQRRKAKWNGRVLRRSCLLKNITGGRRRKQLLDNFRK